MVNKKSIKNLILILTFALLFILIPVNTMAEEVDEPEQTMNDAPPLGQPDVSEEDPETYESGIDDSEIEPYAIDEMEESDEAQVYAVDSYSLSELMLWVSDTMKDTLVSDRSGWALDEDTGCWSTSIYLTSYKISYSQYQDLRFIQYYCPYVTGNTIKASVKYYSSLDIYSRVVITTSLTAEEAAAIISQTDQSIEYYLSLANEGSTLLEQALILHDDICLSVSYDHNYASEIAAGDESCEYANRMFTQNTGVCQAYSYMYMYLMHRLGIECSFVYSDYTVSSNNMNHGWDMIQLNGNWYHVDLTWDDDDNQKYPGYVSHNFFLVSDSAIQQYRRVGIHHDYYEAYSASDTSYDDSYWYSRKVKTVIYNAGQYSYYIGEAGFERYDNTSGECQVIDEITTWEADNNPDYYSYNNSSMAVYNGIIYYSKPKTIWKYDPATECCAEFCNVYDYDGYIYGISINNDSIQYEARSYEEAASYSLGDVILTDIIAEAAPDISGVNLTILSKGKSTLNYYIKLAKNISADQFYVISGFEDDSGSLTEKTLSDYSDCIITDENSAYDPEYVTYRLTYDVYAAYYNRNICIQLLDINSQQIDSTSCSVRTYAETVLSNNDLQYNEAKSIVKKLLNFGTAAQMYFDYDSSNPSNASLSDEDKVVSEIQYEGSSDVNLDPQIDGIYYYGSSLLIETEFTMRHYFMISEGHSIDEFTFSVNGEELVPQEKDGVYYVDITDLKPSAVSTGVVLDISGGGNSTSLNYSVMDYAERVNEIYPSSLLLTLVNAYINFVGVFVSS